MVTTVLPSGLNIAEVTEPCGPGVGAFPGRGCVPEADGAVVTGGNNHTAIWAEAGGVDGVRVTQELTQLLAGGGIPQADGVVRTGGDDDLAIGTKGFKKVAVETVQFLAGGGVPQAHRVIVTDGDDRRAIQG